MSDINEELPPDNHGNIQTKSGAHFDELPATPNFIFSHHGSLLSASKSDGLK
jgi:hypothetical protein